MTRLIREGDSNVWTVVILIVEDDRDIAHVVHDILVSEGYTAVIAATPQAAAAEAVTVGADAVLLDWIMPGFDGRQVAAALRADLRTATLPIILMSAFHRISDAAHEIGTPFMLAKPFNIADLLRLIARALTPSPETTVA